MGLGFFGGFANVGSSGGGIAAPTDFFVTLQGQSGQGTSTFNPSAPPSYNIPDAGSIALGWPDVPSAARYEVSRSTNNGSSWSSLNSNITASPDSQGTRYTDSTASGCVATTYGPTSGQYLAANPYLYRLRAYDSGGNPGPWYTGANQYIFNGNSGGKSVGTPSGGSGSAGGGFKWVGDLSSGYPTNYAVTDGTYGYVCTIDATAAGGGYFLPTTGCNYCTYNQQLNSCNYINFYMKMTNASAIIAMHSEVVGDLPMTPGGASAPHLTGNNLSLTTYVAGGTVIANTYQLYKVPLPDLMTPQSGWSGSGTAVGVQQFAFYKFLWQAQSSTVITIALAWFSYA